VRALLRASICQHRGPVITGAALVPGENELFCARQVVSGFPGRRSAARAGGSRTWLFLLHDELSCARRVLW